MKRVLKWAVPVDDQPHPIGAGPVVLVGTQDDYPGTVYVWTEENLVEPEGVLVKVCGTGEELPPHVTHVGSTQVGALVWHVYRNG